jgi:membrane-bound serine protease (ClpP class)
LAFGLYFFGHFIAGFAGVETVALLVAGIVLILLELFVPGGILGVLGFIALMTGIIMAAFDAMFGIVSLMIAMVVSAVILVLSARYFGTRGTWRKLTLTDRQQNEAGYVSSRSYKELEGKRGMSVTPLRPSGIMMLDGKRYDVVSEGAFVAANQPVVVVQVEGSRIVVRPSGETVQFHHNES